MEIVRDHLRSRFEKMLEPGDGLLVRTEGRGVVEVADVGTEVRRIVDADAERVLEMSATREDGAREPMPHAHGFRHMAARAAQDHRRAGDHLGDGIVAACFDLPVVHQQ